MKYEYPRIRHMREDSDLTQEDIANKLGEHLTTYRRWETGEREMPIHIMLKLCDIYKVTPDYILGIIEEPRK